MLPTEVAEEITIDSLDRFVENIRGLPVAVESFLINRVLRGIEHFRVRKSAAEMATMMESQSAIDATPSRPAGPRKRSARIGKFETANCRSWATAASTLASLRTNKDRIPLRPVCRRIRPT